MNKPLRIEIGVNRRFMILASPDWLLPPTKMLLYSEETEIINMQHDGELSYTKKR